MPLPAQSQATTYPLVISQGSTYSKSFQVADVNGVVYDLTGCTAAAKIRDNFPSATSVVLATLTCNISTTLGVSTITVSQTMSQTAALNVPAATPVDVRAAVIGVWDLEITDGTNTYRFAEGNVTLSREATY